MGTGELKCLNISEMNNVKALKAHAHKQDINLREIAHLLDFECNDKLNYDEFTDKFLKNLLKNNEHS